MEKEKRKKEKYKKRCQRLGGGKKSPRSKVDALLRHETVSNTIRKRLLLQESIIEEIRNKYKNTKKERERQIIAKTTIGKIIKKYRLQRAAQTALGFSKKRGQRQDGGLITFERKESNRLPVDCKQKIKAFFLRDDVSRMTTGRKQTVTQKKIKKQKRLLTDSLKNLHHKFLSETEHQVSYSCFCTLRPFWVVVPTEADRETCQCRTHENLQFMANALYVQGLSATKHIEEMVDATMCDAKSKVCAYGECKDCFSTTHTLLRPPNNTEIAFTKWSLEENEKLNDGEVSGKKSTITVKTTVMTTEDALAGEFHDGLLRFRRHVFNIRWQYRAYRQLRENLRNDECLLHVDFSENYSCKYSQEVQAVHFGGSHQQATLHTGVLYTAAEQSPVTFCSISPSRRHDPPAIWAHLDPVLDMIRERYPLIKHLHVFSDGPATQYKQKGNFYLLSKEPFKKGFKNISWNFFEASHGKGAPDGIGATLKRSADTIVRHGGDIPNAEAMFHKLRGMGTSVELFFVGEDDVERKVKEIIDGPTLVPVKGTMKIHQVLSFSPGTIKYRDITCLCQADKGVLDCECYGLKEISLSQEASPHCTEGPTRPENITKDHIGQWCIINYDGEPYPGIILEVEEDVKVKCMHKNGTNKFHWPSPREDITWYRDDQVVCLMKEPTPLNKRSVQLERKVWDFLEKNWSCWSVA